MSWHSEIQDVLLETPPRFASVRTGLRHTASVCVSAGDEDASHEGASPVAVSSVVKLRGPRCIVPASFAKVHDITVVISPFVRACAVCCIAWR